MIKSLQQATQHLSNLQAQVDATYNAANDRIGDISKRLGFPYYGRSKSIVSFSSKIETGRFKRVSEMNDLVAFSVIVDTLADESKLIDEVRKDFTVTEEKKRATTRKAPDVFRFDNTRLTLQIDSLSPDGSLLPIELQVRTAFEHAWQVVTHDRTYKGKTCEWQALRLAAQMRAHVEQLDLIALEFDVLTKRLTKQSDKRTDRLVDTVKWLRRLVDDGVLTEPELPDDWIRVADSICFLLEKHAENHKAWLKKVRNEIEAEKAGPGLPASLTFFQVFVGLAVRNGLTALDVDQKYFDLTNVAMLLGVDLDGFHEFNYS